ncbi:MAG: carboxylating nicotinate-nucleotide diphosphorylase [Flavobacteriales bacterium]|nr:carboxylating nicotinate-nucleotide diphosphorylase [Flavobacteriales bacterium]
MLPEGTEDLIARALREDIGTGDHTTLATIRADAHGAAHLLVKQEGVLAGVELAEAVLRLQDPDLSMRILLNDGARVRPGDVAFIVKGPSRAILTAERVLLNFMQRMSGIATMTARFVEAVADTGCTVLDTRKTTPLLRAVEKWAVRIGGGGNHRHGLYDMVLIKDNHVDMAGGIAPAVSAAQAYLELHGLQIPVEVETRDLEEVEQVLACGGVDRILLDNFAPPALRQAVELIAHRCATEASGGITLATARAFAETGVDHISVGALTHSPGSLDLSLKALL